MAEKKGSPHGRHHAVRAARAFRIAGGAERGVVRTVSALRDVSRALAERGRRAAGASTVRRSVKATAQALNGAVVAAVIGTLISAVSGALLEYIRILISLLH